MLKNRKIEKLFFVIAIIFLTVACQPSIRFSTSARKIDRERTYKKRRNSKKLAHRNLSKQQRLIIKIAERWIGTPYKYGGTTRAGIDCSAFVKNVYKELGVKLPRTSKQQYVATIPVTNPDIGDLIFFKKKGRVYHVGLYIGNNIMIHASSKRGVTKQNIKTRYYQKYYGGAGRIL